MARILVTGTQSSLASRQQLERIQAAVREAGHDGEVASGLNSADDCDAIIAVLDALDGPAGALVGHALANGKPVLALHSGSPTLELPGMHEGSSEENWIEALPAFYERVKPFAGRVVRDRIPELVKEAGHEVAFRELQTEERPRFLKQKVANEAKELLAAEAGAEKEEVADVLEALEAFIRSRGFDRDDLRRIKEAKRKRRGGFERVFVVESTSQ